MEWTRVFSPEVQVILVFGWENAAEKDRNHDFSNISRIVQCHLND